MRLKLQKYDLALEYTPERNLATADALSRGPELKSDDSKEDHPLEINVVHALSNSPTASITPQDCDRETEIEAQNRGLIASMPVTDQKKRELQIETAKDTVLQQLANTIFTGWPEERKKCLPSLLPYWNYREELCISEGLVLKGSRIVVPTSLRPAMLEKLHVGHLGMEKCKRRARTAIFWPGLNQDINDYISQCSACLNLRSRQPS